MILLTLTKQADPRFCSIESLTTITKTLMSDTDVHAHIIPADIMYFK
jgi:predicted RNA-binding protein with PUA domain